ncbi:Fe2+-dependent dioxygenase [Rivibacter subsaxonicus]|uniref:PKHD-type hydroxylase n=1 Tax=Rivibacter subsaxonicus TaxID=457575 RepID=A0A4V2FU67_9BURK|nr:Fe2+-dependent dioxygenase [Rivibacter subsaxonicus]RZU00806.1 PKHD-type hydroxylase [Rivibacter subsaxonicus]
MVLILPDVLTGSALARAQALLAQAPWADGKRTAGSQSAPVKNNQQLPEDSPAAAELREIVLEALATHAGFFAAALPKRIYPPLFNRYGGSSNAFGDHIDNAMRMLRHGPHRGTQVRTDLSATLFLAEPADYDGGDLVIEEPGGATRRIKLAAGHMVLYPGTRVHRVEPVTRGARLASFFWIESMVRGEEQRALLHDLDQRVTALRERLGDTPELVGLTGTYHNLLRMWGDS